MTLRELLNDFLSLTIFDAGLIFSGVLFIVISFWEWIMIDPVDEERFSGFDLLRERVRVAISPLGYLVLGVAGIAFACL